MPMASCSQETESLPWFPSSLLGWWQVGGPPRNSPSAEGLTNLGLLHDALFPCLMRVMGDRIEKTTGALVDSVVAAPLPEQPFERVPATAPVARVCLPGGSPTQNGCCLGSSSGSSTNTPSPEHPDWWIGSLLIPSVTRIGHKH